MIPIRFAELDDMPRLVAMGMEFLASTQRYQDMIPGNPEALTQHFSQIMASPDAVFFVLGDPGDAFGMLAAVHGRSQHSGLQTAAELFWWVSPARRRFWSGPLLYRAYVEWAKSVGAERIQMTSPSKKVSALYRRLGFQKLEEVYIMKV
jgi:GNAT superfamily N-acetyltransferase